MRKLFANRLVRRFALALLVVGGLALGGCACGDVGRWWDPLGPGCPPVGDPCDPCDTRAAVPGTPALPLVAVRSEVVS